MPEIKAIHCTYFRVGTGLGKWGARLSSVNASGTFPTIDAVKRWARDWAKYKKARLTFERV